MLLDQPALSDSSGASPASTMVRSGSEPPDINGVNGVNEVNGLRRARNPIKVAGITMGSQDNLDTVNDELADVFANRRRRRRSATPVKIGGITMGDQATEQSVLFSTFFILTSLVGQVEARVERKSDWSPIRNDCYNPTPIRAGVRGRGTSVSNSLSNPDIRSMLVKK